MALGNFLRLKRRPLFFMPIVYAEISSAHDHDELDNERKMTLSFQIPVSQ